MTRQFRNIEDHVPVEYLHEILTADFVTGELFWKPRSGSGLQVDGWNARNAGRRVGNRLLSGMLQVNIKYDGIKYYSTVHRVLYALKHGEWLSKKLQIDHIHNNPWENSEGNLRVCTPQQNWRNKKLYKNNTSGFKGVSYIAKIDRWVAIISVNGKNRYVGWYDSILEAAIAYDAAAIKYFGEFARTNFSLGRLTWLYLPLI